MSREKKNRQTISTATQGTGMRDLDPVTQCLFPHQFAHNIPSLLTCLGKEQTSKQTTPLHSKHMHGMEHSSLTGHQPNIGQIRLIPRSTTHSLLFIFTSFILSTNTSLIFTSRLHNVHQTDPEYQHQRCRDHQTTRSSHVCRRCARSPHHHPIAGVSRTTHHLQGFQR
jgi:hypothetical protein